MIGRPVVLIASTSVDVATGLMHQLQDTCLKHGLHLRTGPDDVHPAFASREELFDLLQVQDPVQLCDWLVLLHVGPNVEECFKSALDS